SCSCVSWRIKQARCLLGEIVFGARPRVLWSIRFASARLRNGDRGVIETNKRLIFQGIERYRIYRLFVSVRISHRLPFRCSNSRVAQDSHAGALEALTIEYQHRVPKASAAASRQVTSEHSRAPSGRLLLLVAVLLGAGIPLLVAALTGNLSIPHN